MTGVDTEEVLTLHLAMQSGDGTSEGVSDETREGTDDGTSEGVSDGTREGTDDGTSEGVSDGTREGTDDGTMDGETPSEICQALGATDSISDRFRVLSALEELTERGYVEEVRVAIEGASDEQVVARLTEQGRTFGREIREDVLDRDVEVVDGDSRRHCSLREVARTYDRSPASVLVNLTEDGIYYASPDADFDGLPGRNEVQSELTAQIERSIETEAGRMVLVTGAGGLGKTTLVESTLERLEENERTDGEIEWYRTRCDGSEEPFRALRELASAIAFEDDPFRTTGVNGEEADEVTAHRNALFRNVTDVFTPPSNSRVRVLFLDDLHLADRGTLAYLEYLAGELRDRSLVVVGCVQPAALPESAPAGLGGRTGSETDASVHEITLGPLDQSGTRALLERTVGNRGAPETLVEVVHEWTGGIPLFVEETAAALLESGQLHEQYQWYPETATEMDVPETVTETIEHRLESLDEDVVDVLRWAAVIGERVPIDLLATVADVGGRQLDRFVEVLVDAEVFERVDDAEVFERVDDESVRFRGEIVRRALLEGVSDRQRRRRHRRIATTLASSGGDRAQTTIDSVTIGRHFEAAGEAIEAANHYRSAGREAVEVYAHENALSHYERAARLLERQDGQSATLAGVLTDLASVYRLLGKFEEAVKTTDDGLQVAPAGSRAECRLLGERAGALIERSDFDRARDAAENQRELAVTLGDSTLEAAALRWLGIADEKQGQYERARARYRECLALARELEDELIEVRTLCSLGIVLAHYGQYERSRKRLNECLDRAEKAGYRQVAARALHYRGGVAYYEGEYDRAEECYQRSLEISQELGDRPLAARTYHALGLNAFERGEFDRSRRYYERSIDVRRDIGDRDGEAHSLGNLGLVARRQGEYDRARQYHRQCLAIEREVGARPGEARSLHNLAGIAMLQGDLDAATRLFEQSLTIKREIDDRRGEANSLLSLGECSHQRGVLDRARDRFERALELAESVDFRRGEAKAYRAIGLLDSDEGNYSSARENVRRARERFEELAEPFDIARSDLEAGIVALEDGDLDEARRHVQRASDRFEDLGAKHWYGRARRQLGRIAVRSGQPVVARERWEHALEVFESVGAPQDSLATLRELIETASGRGDDHDDREKWRRQAREILERAPGSIVESHREWVESGH